MIAFPDEIADAKLEVGRGEAVLRVDANPSGTPCVTTSSHAYQADGVLLAEEAAARGSRRRGLDTAASQREALVNRPAAGCMAMRS